MRAVHSQISSIHTFMSPGRHSVIDHVFVDKSICGNVIKYETIDSGVNLLDHIPVSCTLALPHYRSALIVEGLANTAITERTLWAMCCAAIRVIVQCIIILLVSFYKVYGSHMNC